MEENKSTPEVHIPKKRGKPAIYNTVEEKNEARKARQREAYKRNQEKRILNTKNWDIENKSRRIDRDKIRTENNQKFNMLMEFLQKVYNMGISLKQISENLPTTMPESRSSQIVIKDENIVNGRIQTSNSTFKSYESVSTQTEI